MTSKMKTTLVLLTIALAAPATILAGVAAPVAFGVTAVLGLSSIALNDYGKTHSDYMLVTADAKRTERHPLAA